MSSLRDRARDLFSTLSALVLDSGDRTALARQRTDEWRRPEGARPRVYGHRGARHAEPENTLRAFHAAMAEGAEGIELDVRLTADGVPVIAHDEALPAGARDPRGPIDQFPPRLSSLSASQLDAVRLPSGERIPTLAEALRFRSETGAYVNVELKGDVPARGALVRAACDALDTLGSDRILVSSFDPRIVRAVARRCPDVPVAWLVHSGQRILKHSPGWQHIGAVGVHPEGKDLTRERIAALRAQGALVNVWTVNDPDRARELADAGVDGLITDTPRRILNALGG